MPETAFIAIGSNIQPEEYIPKAVERLRDVGQVVAVSHVYRTEPVGPPGQPQYCNAAVAIETDIPPLDLRLRLRTIEADLGRVRSADKFAPRTIDLDIVYYTNITMNRAELTLPSVELISADHIRIPLIDIGASRQIEELRDHSSAGGLDLRADFCCCV